MSRRWIEEYQKFFPPSPNTRNCDNPNCHYNEWEIDLIIYVYWLAITTIMNLWLTSRDYQIDTI